MSIEAEVICDSVCETAPHRLTTMRAKVPCMVVQELARHRTVSMPDFSLSVSSMRAVPLSKQIQRVMDDPAMPVEWGSAKPGMQAGEELNGYDLEVVKGHWLEARNDSVRHVESMNRIGLHKQVASRILQPWSHYEMVITSCSPGWMNFFALRCSRQADPTMRRLAVRMADVYRKSVPQVLQPGWWHLPYVTEYELGILGRDRIEEPHLYRESLRHTLAFSVARCARVSFLRHGMEHSDPDKDIQTHDRFIKSGHWSTFEHQCQAPLKGEWVHPRFSGNLPGWIQYRQTIQPNVHTDFDFSILDTEFSGDL